MQTLQFNAKSMKKALREKKINKHLKIGLIRRKVKLVQDDTTFSILTSLPFGQLQIIYNQ